MLLNHTSPQKVAACRVRGVLFEITEHLHRPKSRKSHANRRNHEKKHWYALVPITSPNCSPLFSFPGIGSHKNLRMFQGCFFQRRWKKHHDLSCTRLLQLQRWTPDQGRTRVTLGVAVKCWVQLRLHFNSPPKGSTRLTFHFTFSIFIAGASHGSRNCM